MSEPAVTIVDARGATALAPPDSLARFLDRHSVGSGPVELEPIGEGHSNVTLAVRRGATEVVLRRPPPGPLPPSAHDVVREAHVLSALSGLTRVPAVLAICEDPDVIGAPFFVMERIPGEVVTATVPTDLDGPGDRRRLGEELVDALVEIHAVDWRRAGLGGMAPPSGYLERQLRRFSGLWEHNRERELPALDRVTAWLVAHCPDSAETTVVHGDFRLGNVVVGRGERGLRLRAVLDWELATLGDPLADLGYMAALWISPDDPDLGIIEQATPTRGGGFQSRAELVERYELRSGRSVVEVRWYEVLALWKAAIFMEGNFKRASSDPAAAGYAAALGETVVALVRRAEQLGPAARARPNERGAQ